MFVLSSLEDNVPVAPRDLARPLLESVADALRARYLDRVVPGLGLAVALYALDAVVGGGGRLYPATGTAGGGAGGGGGGGGGGPGPGDGGAPQGAAYYKARFRMAFFRPFAGEVLVGTLVEATRWGGLRVAIGGGGGGGGAGLGPTPAAAPPPPPLLPPSSSAGAAAAAAATAAAQQRLADAVFRDVIVRPTDMPPKSSWDAKERAWVWSYEDGTPFLMEVGGLIRVRVTGVRYPTPPTPAERRAAQQQAAAVAQAQQAQAQQQQMQQQQQNGGEGASVAPSSSPPSWLDAEVAPPVGSAANPFAPMEVLASANGDGLGMVEWWTPEEDEEEGEEGEEDDQGGGARAAAAPMET